MPAIQRETKKTARMRSLKRVVGALVRMLKGIPLFNGMDYHAEYWRIWRKNNPDACILCAMDAPRHKCPNEKAQRAPV